MSSKQKHFLGGVALIFATYFYFLIFAQFAFLEIVRQTDPSADRLQKVMAAMAAGGLLGSFLVPALVRKGVAIQALLRCGLVSGAAVAVFVYLSFRPVWPLATAIAFAIGLALGLATVGLATSLKRMFAESNWAMGSALGTGLAYAAANLPFIFQAQPRVQALCAAAVSLAAAVIVPPAERFESPAVRPASAPAFAAAYGILFFGILVWFDSAAFYVIQHSGLKVGTWTSKFDLWRNAAVHLLAATAAGVLMKRVQFFPTLGVSFVLLAAGGMSANHPESRAFTGWLYPAGVSLYSACLVAFPAFRLPSQPLRSIAVVAAVLYAFSGWICSGLGIGMAQNLMRIPWQFVALSGIVLAVPAWWAMMKSARRELAYGSIVIAAASLAFIGLPGRPSLANSIERGRAVYVEEGCINCHSQFVKPGSRDELLWGPVRPIEELTGQVPPLFGNRRQGPDLVNIGNRRSREWLRLHFIFPRELSPGSVMPAYDYLFSDERGDALVEYLLTLKSEDPRPIVNWAPAVSCAPDDKIKLTFQRHCAACHGSPNREATIAASANFRRQPPDLSKGPFVYAPPNLPSAVRRMQIARIIKFGIAGTDMPGHEYFNDETTFALTDLVEEMSKTK